MGDNKNILERGSNKGHMNKTCDKEIKFLMIEWTKSTNLCVNYV